MLLYVHNDYQTDFKRFITESGMIPPEMLVKHDDHAVYCLKEEDISLIKLLYPNALIDDVGIGNVDYYWILDYYLAA